MSLLANCRSQLLLDCLGWCLKLFVATDSTSSHEFASQFGLAFLYTRKTQKSYREDRVPRKCLLNAPVTVDRSPATTWTVTTAIIAAKDWAKTAATRVYTFTTWKMWFRIIITSPMRLYSVCKNQQYLLYFTLLYFTLLELFCNRRRLDRQSDPVVYVCHRDSHLIVPSPYIIFPAISWPPLCRRPSGWITIYLFWWTVDANDELFVMFPVWTFILFYFWIGLDMVRSTGNLSSTFKYQGGRIQNNK